MRVDEARIKAFATEFDPQPFHTDAASAAHTIFKGLVAGGWHTAAMTMRLMVEGDLKPAAESSVPALRNSTGRTRWGVTGARPRPDVAPAATRISRATKEATSVEEPMASTIVLPAA